MARIFLTDKDRITVNEGNLVDLSLSDGRCVKELEPRRLFPVSRENEYITLLDADGAEIAVIKSIRDLDADSAKAVVSSLNDYYLTPHITRILSRVDKYGTLRLTVDTDRGVKSFDVRDRNHDIRVYKNGSVRIRDADDNRYTIDNYKQLDPQSKTRLMADI